MNKRFARLLSFVLASVLTIALPVGIFATELPEAGYVADQSLSVTSTSIAKVTVTCPATKEWTGWALTPVPTVKVGSKTLVHGKDFKLAYKNNKNIGTATITITGVGNYTGTVRKTFRIIPKATSITRITGDVQKLTVVWKKQSAQTNGYQIQFSSRSDFKTVKTVKITNNAATSKVLSGLAVNHRYYVRIRTFKTISGKMHYSNWSKALSCVTRKGSTATGTTTTTPSTPGTSKTYACTPAIRAMSAVNAAKALGLTKTTVKNGDIYYTRAGRTPKDGSSYIECDQGEQNRLRDWTLYICDTTVSIMGLTKGTTKATWDRAMSNNGWKGHYDGKTSSAANANLKYDYEKAGDRAEYEIEVNTSNKVVKIIFDND